MVIHEEKQMTSINRIVLSTALVSAIGALGGCMDDGLDPEQQGDNLGEQVSELASDCEGGANGFVDISDSLSGTVQRSVGLGAGVTVTLQSGTVAGAQRGWAKISGATISGDQVRMDWTVDGGAHVKVQCGPFTVSGTNKTKTSAAKITSSSSTYQFRACGRLAGVSAFTCTGWW
jgi:hypothetical protein